MDRSLVSLGSFLLLLIGLVAPSAQAGKVFLDDFEDGSATDGQPVSWVAPGYAQTGTRQVQNGSLVLTANTPYQAMDTDVADQVYRDVSISTQFLATSEDAVGVYARSSMSGPVGNPNQGRQLYAVLLSSGVLSLDHWDSTNVQVLDYTNIGWDPTGKEVRMEFSLFDGRASVFVWEDGTLRPSQPVVQADLSGIPILEEGRIGIFSMPWPTPTTGPVAFRFVEVVPEPSSYVICLTGIVYCLSALRRRRQEWTQSAL